MKFPGISPEFNVKNFDGLFRILLPFLLVTLASLTLGLYLIFFWSGATSETSLRSALLLSINTVSLGLLWTLWRGTAINLTEFLATGLLGTLSVSLASLIIPQQFTALLQWTFPLALTLAILTYAGLKSGFSLAIRLDYSPLAAALIAVAAAIYLNRVNFTRYDLNAPIDYSSYHPDLLFHQSVVNAISESGLPQNGLMSDWPIRYHWFSHAIASSLEVAVDSGPFFALTRLLPIISVLVIALLASNWANSLTPSRFIPYLAALTLTVGKFIADSTGVQINWDSPSQTLSTAFLIYACYVTYLLIQRTKRNSLTLIVVITTFMLAGLKFSSSLVFLSGLAVLAIYVTLWKPDKRWVALSSLVGSLIAVSIVYFSWLQGQTDSGGLDLREFTLSAFNPLNDPAFAITVSLLPGWLGLALLISKRPRNWRVPTSLAIGIALGGLIPLWVLRVDGPNSLWFLTSATSIVWIISIAGAGYMTSAFSRGIGVSTVWILIPALSGSVTTVIIWGLLVSQFNFNSPIIQMLFVVIMACTALVISLWFVQTYKSSLLQTFLILSAATGVMVPITINLSNYLFSKTLPTTKVEFNSSPESQLPTQSLEDQSKIEAVEIGIAAILFAEFLHEGDVVALTSDELLPIALNTRSLTYASNAHLSTGLGPVGSAIEFNARRDRIRSLNENDSDKTINQMCSDGVGWLISNDKVLPDHESDERTKVVANTDNLKLIQLTCE